MHENASNMPEGLWEYIAIVIVVNICSCGV